MRLMQAFAPAPPGKSGYAYYPPIATFAILGLNILIFILMTLAGGSKNAAVLLSFGASFGPYFRAGQIWRIVMPMFLHIGVPHLAVNMAGLLLLGILLEPIYGYGRFSLLYVLSGMGGSLLSMEASSNIAAGASGAIFGIAGAMLVTGIFHPDVVPRRWKGVFGIGVLAAIIANLAFGRLVPHIDNWAHLGGLITGLVLARLIPPAVRLKEQGGRRAGQPVVILPVILVVLAMGATTENAVKARQAVQLLADSARLAAAHQTARAISVLEEARRLSPEDPRIDEQLGALYLAAGQPAKAVAEFQRALRLGPMAPVASIQLVLAYERAGDSTKARALLKEVARSAPRDADTQEALAETCDALKLYPEAIQHYQATLRAAPNSPLALNNLAWLYTTCPDARYRKPAAALQHARRAVVLTGGKQPEILDTLAAALYANGKTQQAVEAEERAVALDPQNRAFQQSLGRYRKAANPRRR